MESVVDESNISNESITSEPLKRRKKRNNLTAEERLAKITSLQYGAPTITKSAPEKPAEVKAVDTLPTEPAVSIAPHIPPEKFAKETLPEQAVLDDLLKNLTNEQLNFTNSDDTYMSRLTDSSFSKEEMKEFPNLESINFDNLFGGNKVQDQFLNKLGLLRRVLVVLLALVSLYNVPMFIVNTDVANTGYLLSYSPIFLQNILLRANRLASESVTTHELLSINGFDFSHKVEKDALSEIVDQMGLNKLKSFGLNLWGYYEIFSNVVSDVLIFVFVIGFFVGLSFM
ncbi:hypothetical protein HK099_008726 [Clydaea vesicula]|uniref:Uncharacterized protein n=1 Tax=Clydaea vesicula TaxID=447962 RepID=A0AAD5TXN4_9FUNG|nr:hypothetical protein HK099_008726 [Clydaea vesicula]